MTDDTIFEGTTNPAEAVKPEVKAEANVPKNDFTDLLSSIRTEDGRQKYPDIETALKSLPHAQTHISKLEQEMAQLRVELEKRKTAEEILSKLEQREDKQEPSTNVPPAITPEQIDALVDKRLSAKEQAAVAKANIGKVTSKMSELFGEKAESTFYSKATEVGLSVAEINKLAAASPEAALRIIGISASSGIPTKTQSNQNSEATVTDPAIPSAKRKPYGTTKDDVAAWRAAGELAKRKYKE